MYKLLHKTAILPNAQPKKKAAASSKKEVALKKEAKPKAIPMRTTFKPISNFQSYQQVLP